jgi:hypothetical protein
MSTSNSVDIVHVFWDQVWNAHDAAAVVTGGETTTGRENYKRWVAGFLAKVNDLHLEVIESFQNAGGSRVASRWLLTGKNNGLLGTQPDQQDIAMTGTAVWAVREDGKLLTNWVERASWEVYQRLTTA